MFCLYHWFSAGLSADLNSPVSESPFPYVCNNHSPTTHTPTVTISLENPKTRPGDILGKTKYKIGFFNSVLE